MRIQLFDNGKGLIYGTDAMRIGCDIEGSLKIGLADIKVSAEAESVMPILFNGASGTHNATFISNGGDVYELEKVTIKRGRIVPPDKTAVDIMEVRCMNEALNKRCDSMQKQIEILSHIFDTNSLNFIIKGE